MTTQATFATEFVNAVLTNLVKGTALTTGGAAGKTNYLNACYITAFKSPTISVETATYSTATGEIIGSQVPPHTFSAPVNVRLPEVHEVTSPTKDVVPPVADTVHNISGLYTAPLSLLK